MSFPSSEVLLGGFAILGVGIWFFILAFSDFWRSPTKERVGYALSFILFPVGAVFYAWRAVDQATGGEWLQALFSGVFSLAMAGILMTVILRAVRVRRKGAGR